MTKLVADLEDQVRAQEADHPQVTAEPVLGPEAQRVAELEASIRRLKVPNSRVEASPDRQSSSKSLYAYRPK